MLGNFRRRLARVYVILYHQSRQIPLIVQMYGFTAEPMVRIHKMVRTIMHVCKLAVPKPSRLLIVDQC